MRNGRGGRAAFAALPLFVIFRSLSESSNHISRNDRSDCRLRRCCYIYASISGTHPLRHRLRSKTSGYAHVSTSPSRRRLGHLLVAEGPNVCGIVTWLDMPRYLALREELGRPAALGG